MANKAKPRKTSKSLKKATKPGAVKLQRVGGPSASPFGHGGPRALPIIPGGR